MCEGCPREFLPNMQSPDAKALSELTKDSIQHLDCFDLGEFYEGISRLREQEPEKFAQDMCLLVFSVIVFIIAMSLLITKCCCKKTPSRKFWLRVHQIPHLEKMGKPQEVPYIKIDEPRVKAWIFLAPCHSSIIAQTVPLGIFIQIFFSDIRLLNLKLLYALWQGYLK